MIRIVNTGATPVVYHMDTSYNQPSTTGTVQWNGPNKCFEVSTGTGWARIDNNINLTTSSDVDMTLAWAKQKMREERELEELMKTNTTVADLVNKIKDTQEQLKLVQTILKAEVKP